ncbi:MAG: primary-amine oxidase [Gammaproteobacteria bacterium]|nr:primary-amine oxidase [Gammaproteobacteria bacterium]
MAISSTQKQDRSTELPPSTHPLDPLNADEIRTTVALLQDAGIAHDKTRFITVTLEEPMKDVLLEWIPDDVLERQAFAVLLDNTDGNTIEALASLTQQKILKHEHIPDVQPAIVLDEFFECEEALKQDKDFQEALRNRGITHFELLMIDPWSVGDYGDEPEQGRRLACALAWTCKEAGENGYAHPVLGLMAWIDLNTMKVIRVEDSGVVPIPGQSGNYAARYFEGKFREAPKPLEIVQPEGPSFSVDGNSVEWLGWSFRIGFNAREGLVLHQIGYSDPAQNSRLRSIIHRVSVSEMVVPYGDPDNNYARRNAFDVGEYGIGLFANSLELGCDCLGLIRYFDAHMATGRGEVMEIRNAVCMHEEDYGILWKHSDWRTGDVEVRRSRRLVVSFIATVGVYEYGFFWYFYLDGTIQLEIKLTGIVSTGALAPGETRKYGTEIAPRLYAPIHQHVFNVRMDMAIDGPNNSVYEVNTRSEPMGPNNPLGNACYAEETLLKNEQDAARNMSLESARHWKIVNPNVTNSLGQPVGYKLVPEVNAFPFSDPQSSVRRRAGFMNHHFWATAYNSRERYAAGDYPNQSDPCVDHGLPDYIKQNRSLENTSLTVWHSLNSHHVVRPEDWPVMPVATIGFHLKPVGFFDRNPAINLPPTSSKGSKNSNDSNCH